MPRSTKTRSTSREAWYRQYGCLVRFLRIHQGRFPSYQEQFPKGNPLGRWCAEQRKNGRFLGKEKKALLNALDFPWAEKRLISDPRCPPDARIEQRWWNQYEALRRFRKHYPDRWPNRRSRGSGKSPELAAWCSIQRAKCRYLSPVKRRLLNELGFPWVSHRRPWLMYLAYLKLFRVVCPDRWPSFDEKFPPDISLGRWTWRQRNRKVNRTLPLSRCKSLNALEFPWTQPNARKRMRGHWPPPKLPHELADQYD